MTLVCVNWSVNWDERVEVVEEGWSGWWALLKVMRPNDRPTERPNDRTENERPNERPNDRGRADGRLVLSFVFFVCLSSLLVCVRVRVVYVCFPSSSRCLSS
jgi:hypothetical protein